jgi:hypothetical protein
MNTVELRYVGNGSFLTKVPARDLTKEEVDLHGGADYLVSTKLYVRATMVVEEMIVEDVAVEIPQTSSKKKSKE